MRIFLAGATGAIGRLLLPLLQEAGHQVTGASRDPRGAAWLRDQGAEAVQVDVFDRDALADAVGAAAPEAIVHQLTALAGGSIADNARIRREGTRNLVDAAHRAGVRRIVAQSISWAYEPGDTPAAESTPLDLGAGEPRATTIAGVHALEQAVAELPEHVILRYGTLHGPGTWYEPNGPVARQLMDLALPADDTVTSFLHVADAARAALAALDWPTGTVNIVDGEPAPAHAWIPLLAAKSDTPAPRPTRGRPGWARGADDTLARTTYDWRPTEGTWRDCFGARGA
ncbi:MULTISPECIES: NAD-dependent epimerase/dehydratase family protein [unclassified Streptomyces]|uniref:NAD-dependent epimerase/dehydratase family protein n=1 Tax=unclassified Streptomyces TaxID=2593676 RepID=UPI0016600AD9|nr:MULTISPECIES: NAD(P)-dependent oxidoreductase [unclassified Streptomyces]MBD0712053.1 dTDP-glucose 4,6-dehydratase [Streptomyces sp. CBMA291]MBD0717962.1 dTDP-glucose 4,6-dehydratase [Streptomyces sp. CBMA370]